MGQHRVAGVDDHRCEGDADQVLEPVGRLDQLVDRRLLGQADEHDLAAGRVPEHLDDLLGLGAQRAAPGRVHEAEGAREEGHRMSGRGRVEHDQVRGAGTLELLDLAEHEHLADAWDGRRHDLEHAARHQALGHTPQAVVLEVLHEGVVRGDHPAPHAPWPVERLVEHRFVVVEGGLQPEQARQPACVVELDHEHLEPGIGRHPSERRRDGRLADTALAGDDDDVALPAECLAIHSGRDYCPPCADLFWPLAQRAPCKDPGGGDRVSMSR